MQNKCTHPSTGCLWLPPLSRSTSAPPDSGFGFSGAAGAGAGVPEAMASCLASTRCKSSFKASPWHNNDSSLKHQMKNEPYLR